MFIGTWGGDAAARWAAEHNIRRGGRVGGHEEELQDLPSPVSLSASGTSNPGQYSTRAGDTVVISNVGGLWGKVIESIGGGQPNAITLNSALVVATYDLANDPIALAHEMGHVEQARWMGGFYIPAYIALQIATATALAAGPRGRQLAGSNFHGAVHTFHPMEIGANLGAGQPPH